ncbi:nuclear fragile X mental retardation-interacting protein 1 [Bradysia coprophila]|uniref:nuclear fragile X mental retardation-interacting protein 1 n=1 Tax=Bradysia coprophila TaxID=38358 RepID=UPI00187DB23D|nr:nuclear fragile X mental retardation-interacting protein 1 [Bradysia coprophila]
MTDNNFLVPQSKSETMPAKKLPCPFSPAGMLQPSHLQPPPMFGPRGTTIPPKHLASYAHFKVNRSQPRSAVHHKTFNNHNRPKDSVPRYQNNFNNDNRPRGPQRSPGSREFWCEPCDRDFRSLDLLHEHKSQHQKCGIDGCKFEGHEMIVSKHITMQHSTGLYERLKNLDTPEDIQKWREERRKRYPTKENVELRQQMQEERNKRGEKLNDSKARFGRQSDRRRCNNNSTDSNRAATTDGNRAATEPKGEANSQKKGREGRKKRRRPNKKVVKIVEEPAGECDKNENVEDVSNNGLPMFRGTSHLKNYKKRKEVQPKNALSSLLGAYESDSNSSESFSEDEESSDDMDSPVTTLTSTVKSQSDSVADTCSTEVEVVSNEQSSVVDKCREDLSYEDNADDMICDPELPESSVQTVDDDNDMDELPSEERILKMESDVDSLPPLEAAKVVNRRTKPKVLDKRLSKRPTVMDLSKKYRNQNTMLEKLLQNEIRHERNVLLQCVRHVVKENFFGVGQKPVATSTIE